MAECVERFDDVFGNVYLRPRHLLDIISVGVGHRSIFSFADAIENVEATRVATRCLKHRRNDTLMT